MKTVIEPHRINVSLTKLANFISGSFVALYITAMEAVNGRSHNIDRGVIPMLSGEVNVASIKMFSRAIAIFRYFYHRLDTQNKQH